MRQPYFSIAVGAFLGLFMLSITFASLSLIRPGWLRSLLVPDHPLPPPLVTQIAHSDEPIILPTLPPGITPTPEATAEPLPTAATGECGGPQSMTIALLGVDARDDSFRARTDAITLVNVNFVTPSAAMLSIPRDLYVPLPNLEAYDIDQSRINTAFLYGEVYEVPGGGPAEFKQTVELNFGIRVDRYILINFGAFKAGVDALGGIDVNVPKAIYDPAFPLDDGLGSTTVFEMPAGLQHMDGETALRYVRTRHQDDDYRRIQRQQDVLLAIRDKLLRPEVLPQIPALITALTGAGRTDLSPGEIAALACLGPRIDRSAIKALPIDGTMVIAWTTPEGGRVSIPNRERIATLVQEFLSVGQPRVAEP